MYKRFDKNYNIISNNHVKDKYFKLNIHVGNNVIYCNPGQFFMLNLPGHILRRPFSIHDINMQDQSISFLYKVVGKGTKELSQVRKGKIKLLGPLGNGYNLNNCEQENCNNIIIAGGSGIASLYILAKKLKKTGTLYYGVRSKTDLICVDQFISLNWKVIVATEDGSIGYKGYIVDLVENLIKKNDIIFACGPHNMLIKIQQIIYKNQISGFISFEAKMGCGFGNCQSCTIVINNQLQKVCTDGPIFKICSFQHYKIK
ncbi:MAG: dihydroorotate dehydrogenase electron transfer subunit [Endomicrobium sp.]|jgi:dihydroorotate dehydrogenase electron transfer subunit|nr:dihydroorotate dehydrogenase electron transfer subunit [Endomicrobium sp.]